MVQLVNLDAPRMPAMRSSTSSDSGTGWGSKLTTPLHTLCPAPGALLCSATHIAFSRSSSLTAASFLRLMASQEPCTARARAFKSSMR